MSAVMVGLTIYVLSPFIVLTITAMILAALPARWRQWLTGGKVK